MQKLHKMNNAATSKIRAGAASTTSPSGWSSINHVAAAAVRGSCRRRCRPPRPRTQLPQYPSGGRRSRSTLATLVAHATVSAPLSSRWSRRRRALAAKGATTSCRAPAATTAAPRPREGGSGGQGCSHCRHRVSPQPRRERRHAVARPATPRPKEGGSGGRGCRYGRPEAEPAALEADPAAGSRRRLSAPWTGHPPRECEGRKKEKKGGKLEPRRRLSCSRMDFRRWRDGGQGWGQ
ncbi:hypothetical protein PVAP13_2KG449005 [Panicum virgatum]|uniref:Uncharacterized protein n=1 Tax=Panicum virgatum TaxID=38727 RepID=A0A8T0WM45_PANVG|nr:hypothetical protein PVAP13_2KG449005 [Panicum virgatum]